MPRGKGRQTTTEGQAYPNRTDLQDAPIVPGGTVGDREGLEAALAATPQVAVPPAPSVTPDDVPGMLDPSGRPQEPIQSGLAQGPGVGPLLNQAEDMPATLAALYERFPSPALRELVESAQLRQGM